MEQNHGRNSLLEKELKKGVVKSTAPIGLIITALGLGDCDDHWELSDQIYPRAAAAE